MAGPKPARRYVVAGSRRVNSRLLRLAAAMQAPAGTIVHLVDHTKPAHDAPTLLRAGDAPADPTWPPARGRR